MPHISEAVTTSFSFFLKLCHFLTPHAILVLTLLPRRPCCWFVVPARTFHQRRYCHPLQAIRRHQLADWAAISGAQRLGDGAAG